MIPATLTTLFITVVVVIVLLWLINYKLPFPPNFKPYDGQMIRFILGAIVVGVAIWRIWPLLFK